MSVAKPYSKPDTAPLAVSDTAGNPLERLLSYRIARLHLAMEGQATEVLKKVSELTLGQWRIMVMLGELGTLSSKDLGQLTRIDGALISRTVRSLELEALITVSRPEHDRRLLLVTLTPEGETQYKRILPSMRARQKAHIESIDRDEREQLHSIIAKLEKAASIRSF